MSKKNIDEKFEKKNMFDVHCTQIISKYEDFQKLGKKNYHLAIIPEENGHEFDAYWQGIKSVGDQTQSIYLQIKFLEGPIITEKVVEYEFPLKGQIKLSDFQKGKKSEYFFSQ